MQSPSDELWPGSRPLGPAALFALGVELSRLAAARHAAGAAGGVDTAVRSADGQLSLGPPSTQALPIDDVRQIGRLLLEGALVRLPDGEVVSDAHLLAHLALVAELPASLLALLADATSPLLRLRPPDGVALWARLASARALAGVRAAAPAPHQADWTVAHDTHIGAYKSRLGQTNQDAMLYHASGRLSLLLVADGISVSTAGSGNLASALLVQAAASMWSQQADQLEGAPPEALDAFLVEVLAEANQTVCEASQRLAGANLRQHIPMGTTAVAALIRGADIHIANLGDSRAYLVGPQGAALLTGDQNLRGEWLSSWQTPSPLHMSGDGHALVGYIGHFNADAEPEALPPQLRRVRALPGEVLLLCSDGFNDYAARSHAEISQLIAQALGEDDLTASARRLVEYANIGGGGDNVTVLLARLAPS